jgi:hypothetical protein
MVTDWPRIEDVAADETCATGSYTVEVMVTDPGVN